MSTWNSTWPIGNNSVKQNTIPGQQNTAYLETSLKVNHFFNNGTDLNGNHQFVQMPKYTTGLMETPNDPSLLSSMDLASYARQKTIAEQNGPIQEVLPYARNKQCIMEILGIKACVLFSALTVFPYTSKILYSHNVSSAISSTKGIFTIAFATSLPTSNYLVLGGAMQNTNAEVSTLFSVRSNTTPSSAKNIDFVLVNFYDFKSNTLVAPVQAWVVCFGG